MRTRAEVDNNMLGAGYTRSQVLAGRQLSSERKPLGNGHLTPGPESPGSGPKGSRAPLAHRPGRCSQKGRHAHGCRVPPFPLGRASRHSERATRQSVVARTNHQLQDLKLSDQCKCITFWFPAYSWCNRAGSCGRYQRAISSSSWPPTATPATLQDTVAFDTV